MRLRKNDRTAFLGFWPVFAHCHRRPNGTRQATNRGDTTIKMTIDEFAERVRDSRGLWRVLRHLRPVHVVCSAPRGNRRNAAEAAVGAFTMNFRYRDNAKLLKFERRTLDPTLSMA